MLLQLTGSLLVLAAFCALTTRRTEPTAVPYLLANVFGAGLLAVDALHLHQWGFLLLETVWALVALHVLGRVTISRRRGRSR